ncbi:MAG: hypothetical protein ACRCVA_00770 [Phreatobacter sp.]
MTAQCPDVLTLRGRHQELCAIPLEGYLRRLRKAVRPAFRMTSTACRRGYIARWEVREDALYLVELEGRIERNGERLDANLGMALPWLKPPVLATWVSDCLRCPEGRLISYRHFGFASQYERDRLLHVEKGRVREEWLRLNPPEPIWYKIAADGGRTRFEYPHPEEPELDDPFPPEATPQGHYFWGQPPAEDDDESYVCGGDHLIWPPPPAL